MKQRPILFSAPMVQAILAGRKTQTRRIVKPQPTLITDAGKHSQYNYRGGIYSLNMYRNSKIIEKCPHGQVGDQLWVKETWKPRIAHSCALDTCDCSDVEVEYIADNKTIFYSDNIDSEWLMPKAAQNGKNVSSLFMPRWASRILLEITDIRIERLQDISEADAQAEGCDNSKSESAIEVGWYEKPRRAFERLWESINGTDSWAANSWVWVVEFKVVQGGDL